MTQQDLVIKVKECLRRTDLTPKEACALYYEVVAALEQGSIRVAAKNANNWQINSWIKEVILLGFKYGKLVAYSAPCGNFYDKDTLPLQQLKLAHNIRIVPGGSAIRCGAYVAPGTVIMPPAYINIGAYIDTGCMIDSHALIGSCAQIGKNVHVSAGAQIGGVLEPINSLPVIIEDNVFVGGNCGVYEGTIVQTGAVLGSGVILNGSTWVFDNTTGEFLKKTSAKPLTIPQNAVVVPGTKPIVAGYGAQKNMHVCCPIIIKYRDIKTAAAIALESALR